MTESACYHCGLPVSESGKVTGHIKGGERLFCCEGCKSVSFAICEAGLESFYNKVPEDINLTISPEISAQADIYDIDEVQSEFTDTNSDIREVTLLVEGMHCAACVWLIEKVLEKTEGVEESRVNFAAKKLRVRWNNTKIKLSEIIRKVGSVGYSSVPYSANAAIEETESSRRSSLFRIGFSGFAAMNMMWISIALWTGAAEGEYRDFFRLTGMGLAFFTMVYPGYPFFKNSFLGLKSFYLTMDLPIAIGASVTFLYSSYITLFAPESGEVYFDTVVALIFIILIGRHLETSSRARAMDATGRLMQLQPKVATVLRNGMEEAVHVKTVKKGETILIRPGERIPLDSEVIEGESDVDESVITGESQMVEKTVGGFLVAGAMNGNGSLTAKVTKSLSDSSLSKMAKLIDEAQTTKAPTQRMAEKIVPWFIAATISISAFTFYFWYGAGLEKALLTAVSTLIITCPCALGLATPMAITAGMSLGSRIGVLIKNGASIETLAKADRFVFDKTGALTEGKRSVIEITAFNGYSEDELLSISASVESRSEHNIAKAIVSAAKNENIDITRSNLKSFKASPGYGVAAIMGGEEVAIGSGEWMGEHGIVTKGIDLQEYSAKGQTVVFCAIGKKLAGLFVVGDRLRDGSFEVVDFLKKERSKISILTGDVRGVAEHVARSLNLSGSDGIEIKSELKPEDKYAEIERYQKKEKEVVVMIGDGVNDAPALVKADVGIAISSGADVTVQSADMILTGGSLRKLVKTIKLSRITTRVIRQNIAISLIYNAVLVPMAVMGLVTPVFAAIVMPLSSLTVVGNTFRVRKEQVL